MASTTTETAPVMGEWTGQRCKGTKGRERARRHNLLSPTFLLENASEKSLDGEETCDVPSPTWGTHHSRVQHGGVMHLMIWPFTRGLLD